MSVLLHCIISGFDSDLIYPNGLACTMPVEYQQKIINCLPGLENAEIAMPGRFICC